MDFDLFANEVPVRAINKVHKIIESEPASKEAAVLMELVLALESKEAFALEKIYELEYKRFELAVALITEWRLDRHYASKFRLISTALHAKTLQSN